MNDLPGCAEFLTGYNYWSSESGLKMWREWSEEAVEKDFAAMKTSGANAVRLFPLWPDFQPVSWACQCAGKHVELVMPDGNALPETGLRHWGLDPVMMERFRRTADLAAKYDLKLIVGLLTGWMSGALFVPPALADKNLYTHPDALYLETLFLRGFVNAMKDHPAILAWEPGNECNCLSATDDATVTWNWLNMVVTTIRQADPSRPVYSGMHGARIDPRHTWSQIIQSELTDALTTHPYPAFTPYCGQSALNTIPAVYHAPAETLFYQAAGRPAFIEEIGSFGPEYISDERTEAYFYTVLHAAYAHGLGGALWWCAFAFDRCSAQFPYRWIALERNLGAMDADRNDLGAARAMRRFREDLRALPCSELPPRRVDCIAVTTMNPEMWLAAYGCFILSTQAGFGIGFHDILSRDVLPEKKFYLVPSIAGQTALPLDRYEQLLRAAENGAAVCFTAGTGMLQPFGRLFGCRVDYRTRLPEKVRFTLDGLEDVFEVESPAAKRLIADTCEVHGRDETGDPVLIRQSYGKGCLIYLNVPVENAAVTEECRLYQVYRKIAELAGLDLPDKAPELGITHHPLPEGGEVRITINYAGHEAGGMAPNGMKIEKIQL